MSNQPNIYDPNYKPEPNAKKKCPVIIICLCFTLSIFIAPFILGVYLYVRNIQIDKEEKNKAIDKITGLKSEIKYYSDEKEKAQSEYNNAVQEKDTLLYKYREEAKAEAEKEISDKLEQCRETLKQLEQDISVKELMLNDLNAEYNKSLKNVESNANRVVKLKEVYKSFQYAIKAYESNSDSQLNEALISMADETLLPIVEIKLNCMNVKQLKSRYNMEQRNIQEAFKRYEGRYTTK